MFYFVHSEAKCFHIAVYATNENPAENAIHHFSPHKKWR